MVQVHIAHIIVLVQSVGQDFGIDAQLFSHFFNGISLEVAVIAGSLGLLSSLLEHMECFSGMDDIEDIGAVLGVVLDQVAVHDAVCASAGL